MLALKLESCDRAASASNPCFLSNDRLVSMCASICLSLRRGLTLTSITLALVVATGTYQGFMPPQYMVSPFPVSIVVALLHSLCRKGAMTAESRLRSSTHFREPHVSLPSNCSASPADVWWPRCSCNVPARLPYPAGRWCQR